MRSRPFRHLLLAVLALCLTLPANAFARKQVPRDFFGVAVDGPALRADGSLGREAKRIRATGTRSVRAAARWFQLEPQDGELQLRSFDRLVLSAAKQRIRVLPTVHTTPGWASVDGLGGEGAVPRDPSTYARFLTALVARYGPRGTLWAENPRAPRMAIRQWEVWNEPGIRFYWSEPDWQHGYVRLLRASYAALKRADPGSTVIAAGQANAAWIHADELYDAGGGPFFDALGVHPYTANADRVMQILTFMRRSMSEHDDAEKPLIITEMGFSSGLGRAGKTFGWETDEAGQALLVKALLPAIAQQHKRQRIIGAYWYTWQTDERRATDSFEFSGLNRVLSDGRAVPKPALASWIQTVRDLTQ